MNTDHTTSVATRTVDLTGLPESVVQQVMQLVQQARQKQAEEAAGTTGKRKPLIGRLAHLGLKTPSLEEFEEARREMWANFPREFPDPTT